ncbi:hypothetical protein C3Y87_16365 [Carbonactinospora thermoautotrophica]|nr:hypothetical protein [Carbonactinospora thermoautotrophica]
MNQVRCAVVAWSTAAFDGAERSPDVAASGYGVSRFDITPHGHVAVAEAHDSGCGEPRPARALPATAWFQFLLRAARSEPGTEAFPF